MITRHPLRLLGALLALLVTGSTEPPAHAEEPPSEGTFSARWVVTGTWRGLGLDEKREVILADLGGRLDVTRSDGVIVDLASRCLVFWDSAKGGTGRCRWRHPSGDELFSEIEGGLLAPDAPVTGRFVGGTGRYAGFVGEFGFGRWSALSIEREGRTPDQPEPIGRALSAFTNDLTGAWRRP